MTFLARKLEVSPELARMAPFGIYALLTALQGEFGPASLFWLYIVKTLLAAWMIWQVRPYVEEMRWKVSWEAIAVGVAICVIWVGTDGLYPRLAKLGEGADPLRQFGAGSIAARFYIAVHLAGMTLIVPPAEEVFYRSLVYRMLVKSDFRSMPLGRFHALSFVVTSVIFGLMHPQWWLAGIVCGLAYQWLVVSKNRLGDAMTAHAVTNLLLGIWIVWRGAWRFW